MPKIKVKCGNCDQCKDADTKWEQRRKQECFMGLTPSECEFINVDCGRGYCVRMEEGYGNEW